MEKITCGKCHFENRKAKHFCEKCGAFLHTADFDEKIYALPEMKMMRVVDNLLNVPHYSINLLHKLGRRDGRIFCKS